MTMNWHDRPMSRRGVLSLGAAAVTSLALAGCGDGAKSGSGAGGKHGALKLPAYKPAGHAEGAITSDNTFVPNAFESYPRPPFTSVPKTPAHGGQVTACVLDWGPPPPGKAKNVWAQQLDKRLGTTWNPTVIPAASYDTKVAAILASGEIPDVMWVQPDYQQPVAQAVQQGAFVDLSEILAGDGIKDYPNLATVPSYLWKRSSVEGAIYGIPRPLYLLNKVDVYRADWAAKLGYPDPPKNADEVFELLTAFSHGKAAGKVKTWGIAAFDVRITEFVGNMFRMPNQWRVNKDGSFEYYVETDEYEATLTYMRKLWKEGVFHPDALLFQTQSDKSADLFISGRTGFYRPPPAGWFPANSDLDELTKNDPKARPELLVTPGHDGGQPLNAQTNGWWGIGVISAEAGKDDKRLGELLHVLDYWAAPFGSKEYTFLNYGVEGRHFNFDAKGDPVGVDNEKLTNEMAANYFINPSESVIYYPGTKGRARMVHDYYEKQLAHSAADPSLGLLSETKLKKVTALTSLNTSYENDIVSGRKPLSALKEWRQRWRSGGGDKMRKEYEDSYQRSKGDGGK
ncbi:extracellular solute-binding protein [Actinopolymorpha rutila]|uniref:Putative aldouronate transport system substrate-binding protein n=1 Tax=Actinopolymorpha rutila TaxID=446787 RepID=A0A852ZHK4_9ACTN|nr:extracellular solute-binding protein [Actinopolymorpha rutila]NYH87766.1 putative aldouronate transport system substrate-binding protein [Actinopolymorpha rutila]